VIDTGVSYTAVDVVLPHPFYAPLHWVCIVNPAERTRLSLVELTHRAHLRAQRQESHRR
jgi:hypothetical protein